MLIAKFKFADIDIDNILFTKSMIATAKPLILVLNNSENSIYTIQKD